MILISRSPVEFACGIVSPINFEMDGIHAHLVGLLFDKGNCLTAKSASSEGGLDVQLVDECVVAMELKAEAQRQDDIADRFGPFTEKPNFPEGGHRQEPPEGHANRRLVKFDGSRLLFRQFAHHGEELGFVGESCLSNG